MKTDLRLLREDVTGLREHGLPTCAIHNMQVHEVVSEMKAAKDRLAKLELVEGNKTGKMIIAFTAAGAGFGFVAKFLWDLIGSSPK
jgi:hypothetical protein